MDRLGPGIGLMVAGRGSLVLVGMGSRHEE
jgi:hypothetical protein